MTATNDSLVIEDETLSRSVVVALTRDRLAIPSFEPGDALELRVPELMLLHAIVQSTSQPLDVLVRTVAERTQSDPERLRRLLDELRARTLLIARDFHRGSDRREGAATRTREGPASIDGAGVLAMKLPMLFRVRPRGFELLDHDGHVRVRLDSVELAAASEFRAPTNRSDAFEAHRRFAAPNALDASTFDTLLARLAAADLLFAFDPDDPTHLGAEGRSARDFRRALSQLRELLQAGDRRAAQHDVAERERRERTRARRVAVVAVHADEPIAPLSLGFILA